MHFGPVSAIGPMRPRVLGRCPAPIRPLMMLFRHQNFTFSDVVGAA